MLYEKYNGFSTSSGDSKYNSLFKDFDLYPDNFIGKANEVTAASVIEKKQNAINNFKQKEKMIYNRLQDNKNNYLTFLSKTVK